MERFVPTEVIVVPWYERKDFEKVRLMNQCESFPLNYDAWQDNAFRDMRQLLKQGCALKIVTIHLDDYSAWLADKGAADSVATRTRYITELATIGSQLPDATVHADVPWPGFPATH